MPKPLDAEVRRSTDGQVYGLVRFPGMTLILSSEQARLLSYNLRTLAIDIERGQVDERTYPEPTA